MHPLLLSYKHLKFIVTPPQIIIFDFPRGGSWKKYDDSKCTHETEKPKPYFLAEKWIIVKNSPNTPWRRGSEGVDRRPSQASRRFSSYVLTLMESRIVSKRNAALWFSSFFSFIRACVSVCIVSWGDVGICRHKLCVTCLIRGSYERIVRKYFIGVKENVVWCEEKRRKKILCALVWPKRAQYHAVDAVVLNQ